MEIRNCVDGIILDVGSDGVRVWNIAVKVGYSSVGIRDIGTNFRRGSMDSRWKFGLGAQSQYSVLSSDQTEVIDGTHVEDLKSPVEVRPPGDDPLLILPRVKKSRDGIPFAPLDKLPLNLCHCPTIESILLNNSKRISLVQLTPLAGLSHPARTD